MRLRFVRFGGPEEDHQLHHCCWTGRVGEQEEEEEEEEEDSDERRGHCHGS